MNIYFWRIRFIPVMVKLVLSLEQAYHHHHGIFLPTCSDTLPPIPFHAQGTRFTGDF